MRLLVGFYPATRSAQSTPADNTQKRVLQYTEKERNGELHNVSFRAFNGLEAEGYFMYWVFLNFITDSILFIF